MGGTYKNRFDRYPDGAVPQNAHGRTPEQQLQYLDRAGYTAVKERTRLLKRIERAKEEKK